MQEQESSSKSSGSSVSEILDKIREEYGLKKETISGTEFHEFLKDGTPAECKDCFESFVGYHYGKFLTKVHQMSCRDKEFCRKLKMSFLGQTKIQ